MGSHGIRLDIYTTDPDNTFDIEMQSYDQEGVLLRARYYTGCMDVDQLKSSVDYLTLKTSYVIFICKNDPFKKGFPLYTYRTTCDEDRTLEDDRTKKLFYNVSACKVPKAMPSTGGLT